VGRVSRPRPERLRAILRPPFFRSRKRRPIEHERRTESRPAGRPDRGGPARHAHGAYPQPAQEEERHPPAEAPAAASAADGTDAKPKPRRAPRKPRVKKTEAPSGEVTADLFALTEGSPEAAAEVVTEVAPEQASLATAPAEPAPVPQPESEPLAALVVAGEVSGLADVESDDVHADVTSSEGEGPSGPRRKRKRRRGKGVPTGKQPGASRSRCRAWPTAWPGSPKPYRSPRHRLMPSRRSTRTHRRPPIRCPKSRPPPEPLPPLTVVSLGLELPPVLSAAALERCARRG
jgi:hypothetical protein